MGLLVKGWEVGLTVLVTTLYEARSSAAECTLTAARVDARPFQFRKECRERRAEVLRRSSSQFQSWSPVVLGGAQFDTAIVAKSSRNPGSPDAARMPVFGVAFTELTILMVVTGCLVWYYRSKELTPAG